MPTLKASTHLLLVAATLHGTDVGISAIFSMGLAGISLLIHYSWTRQYGHHLQGGDLNSTDLN